MKHKKPRTLKSRIKAYLKEHNCSITAREVPLKFDRNMSVADAEDYLYVLEKGDKLIAKQLIPDEGDGIRYAYYYDKEIKITRRSD